MKKTYIYLLFFSLVIIILYDTLYPILGTLMMPLQLLAIAVIVLSIPNYLREERHENFLNSTVFLSLILFIYFVVSPKTEAGTTALKTCLYCLLVTLPFYIVRFDSKQIARFFWILSVCCVWAFYSKLTSMRMEDESAYGGGFLALVCLPLGLYNLRNKKLSYRLIWFIVIIVCVVISLKRGDILALFASTVVYFTIFLFLKGRRNNFKYILLLCVASVIIGVALDRFVSSSELAQTRLEKTREGDTSNRDIIYAYYWNHFWDSGIEKKILGNGFSATSTILGEAAHNDWLEVLTDEGIIGVIAYLIMVLSLFRLTRKKTLPDSFRPIIGMIFTIVLIKSIFSMLIFSLPTTIMFALLGYMLNPETIQKERLLTSCS